MNPEALLHTVFRAALRSVDPAQCLPPFLPPPPKGRTIVIGAGKAAAAMARAVEDHWNGELSGLAVTRYGHGVPCERIEVIEAAHPVPDEAGIAAADRALGLLQGLTKNDLVLFLGSGGGSALLTAPASGIALSDKQAVTRALLVSGASIGEINAVRKHLSRIKGGRLALAASPAPVVGLLISDVANDDPQVIASGPTVPDTTTRGEALNILTRYRVMVPERVTEFLSSPLSETPKPGHSYFAEVRNIVVATAHHALDAAKREVEGLGVRAYIFDYAVEGDAHLSAKNHAANVKKLAQDHPGLSVMLLSGGEVTVEVKGGGRGGRNAQFLLALALELESISGIWALACDTDGIDGTEDNAGAILRPGSIAHARALGLNPEDLLASNDAYGFFEKMNALVRTGPTRTNVNDFRAIFIGRD